MTREEFLAIPRGARLKFEGGVYKARSHDDDNDLRVGTESGESRSWLFVEDCEGVEYADEPQTSQGPGPDPASLPALALALYIDDEREEHQRVIRKALADAYADVYEQGRQAGIAEGRKSVRAEAE